MDIEKQQKIINLKNKLARGLAKIIKNWVLLPLLIIGLHFIGLTLPFGYESLSYWQAVFLTHIMNFLHNLFRFNDNNKGH